MTWLAVEISWLTVIGYRRRRHYKWRPDLINFRCSSWLTWLIDMRWMPVTGLDIYIFYCLWYRLQPHTQHVRNIYVDVLYKFTFNTYLLTYLLTGNGPTDLNPRFSLIRASFPRKAFPRNVAQGYVSARCDSRAETYPCASYIESTDWARVTERSADRDGQTAVYSTQKWTILHILTSEFLILKEYRIEAWYEISWAIIISANFHGIWKRGFWTHGGGGSRLAK